MQLSQEHRDAYIDRSGTLHPVEHSLYLSSILLHHASDINIPVKKKFPPIKEVTKQSGFQLFPSSIQTLNNTTYELEQQQQQSAKNSVTVVDQAC